MPFKATYTELKIRADTAEVVAVAKVDLEPAKGTVEILGLPVGIDMNDINVSSEQAYCDVESFVDASNLENRLSRNPQVSIVQNVDAIEDEDDTNISGRLISNHQREEGGFAIIKDDGTPVIFSNPMGIQRIELQEKLRADPVLRVAYSVEKHLGDAIIQVNHTLRGLSYGDIVYELELADKKLRLSPFVYVHNRSPLDFENVKLSLVMPGKPRPQGDRVIPDVSPLEEYLQRSEDISVRAGRIAREAAAIRRAKVRALADTEGMGSADALMALEAEVEPQETIEGSVASVDTEGTYSLSQGENKRARLKGTEVEGYHRSNVLLLNPGKYGESGTYLTSIIDAVRLTPNTDLKAGSFYSDGQQLQFPAMKKGEEYELGLRTCRNLEAEVSKHEQTSSGGRGEKIVTTTYDVKLVNNTESEQKVEINIPIRAIEKAGSQFSPVKGILKYMTTTIAGEKYHVAELSVGAGKSFDFAFTLQTK